jgi:hypothetical protein
MPQKKFAGHAANPNRVVRLFAVAILLLGTVGLAAVPVIIPALWVAAPSGPHPSDDAMIAHWQAHRDAFEQLVSMVHDDTRLKRLGKDYTEPEDLEAAGISPQRLALYRELCRRAELPGGFFRHGRSVEFLFHASGIPVSGSAKSFVYDEATPSGDEVTGDLETAAAELGTHLVYRRIAQNWWLLLE